MPGAADSLRRPGRVRHIRSPPSTHFTPQQVPQPAAQAGQSPQPRAQPSQLPPQWALAGTTVHGFEAAQQSADLTQQPAAPQQSAQLPAQHAEQSTSHAGQPPQPSAQPAHRTAQQPAGLSAWTAPEVPVPSQPITPARDRVAANSDLVAIMIRSPLFGME